MSKKYRNLYTEIISEENIRAAAERAAKGKRSSFGYLSFKENYEPNLKDIQDRLENETWQAGPIREFMIFEPKPRKIAAPSFADRVVHHSLISVIEPIFEKTFLPASFACRKGKGTHAGVKWVQSQIRKDKYKYFLKTDFSAYFASIDRATLHAEFRKKISCQKTLELIEKIIPTEGKGIPIGSLTSQLSANIYGNILDHFIHHELKLTFVRYMDDVVVLTETGEQAREAKAAIENFSNETLELKLSHWQVSNISRGINFLGYRIWPGHKLLRKSSVTAAKRKIRKYSKLGNFDAMKNFLGAWGGHTLSADARNLRYKLNEAYNLIQYLKKKPKKTRVKLLNELLES